MAPPTNRGAAFGAATSAAAKAGQGFGGKPSFAGKPAFAKGGKVVNKKPSPFVKGKKPAFSKGGKVKKGAC